MSIHNSAVGHLTYRRTKKKTGRRMYYNKLFKGKAYKQCCAIVYKVMGDRCLVCKGDTYISYILPIERHPELCTDVFNMQPLCKECRKGNEADYRTDDHVRSLVEYMDYHDINVKRLKNTYLGVSEFEWFKGKYKG